MTRESKLEHIYAMKAELEQLGCQVVITDHYPDEDLLEVTIVYPLDVPPPAADSRSDVPPAADVDTEQDDPGAPDGWYDDDGSDIDDNTPQPAAGDDPDWIPF